jgi:hypothetical protein
MVKNTKGGTGHKKQAHKSTNVVRTNTVMSSHEDEVYVVITKICGGMNYLVKTLENETLFCKAGKKFMKESSQHIIGCYLLVGIRTWDSKTNSGLRKCDIIETYNSRDIDFIKSKVTANWNNLVINNSSTNSNELIDDGFDMSNEAYEKSILINQVKENNKVENIVTSIQTDNEQKLNFDDI